VTAHVEALQTVQANAASSTDILALLPKDFQDAFTDPAVWDAQWQIVRPAIEHNDGLYTPEIVDATLNAALKSGAITEVTDELRARFHNEYVEKAYETLG
jgi:hypothetical protein